MTTRRATALLAGATLTVAALCTAFGNTTRPASGSGLLDYTTSVTTYDDGTNPAFRQQQIVSVVSVP